MVQWLALFTSNAEGLSSILGLGNSACHQMHTDIIKLKKQKHSQQLQQPLVILLKTHSQDSDQQNDCNIQSGAPTQILLSGPPDPILRLYSCVVSPHQTLPSKNGARPQANLSHCPPATDSRQLPSIPITPAAPLMHFNRKVALVSSLSLLHLHKLTDRSPQGYKISPDDFKRKEEEAFVLLCI